MERKIKVNEDKSIMGSTLVFDEDMAEFCGVIMGDGNIWSNNRKYEITITGHKIDDKEYYDHLYSFVEKNIKKNPYYRVRGGVRLTVYSKVFHNFITKEIGIPERMLKSASPIPKKIKKNRTFLRRFIRGMFDTDGTVFNSDKPGSPNYPTLEITNGNVALVNDIYEALKKDGFRVHLRKTTKGCYKISVYGQKMVGMWYDLIGSSNPHKMRRIQSILNVSIKRL